MTKKQYEQIITAIMNGSGLSPIFEDDYYENLCGTTIANFLEGFIRQFDVPRDHWAFNYFNLEFMDSPQKTLNFLLDHKKELIND